MERIFDLEKLLEISREERQRLKGELFKATEALTLHAQLVQDRDEAKQERVLAETTLQQYIRELDTIACAVVELPTKTQPNGSCDGRDRKLNCVSSPKINGRRPHFQSTNLKNLSIEEKAKFIQTALRGTQENAHFHQERCGRAAMHLLVQLLHKLSRARCFFAFHVLRRSRVKCLKELSFSRKLSRCTIVEKFVDARLVTGLHGYVSEWARVTRLTRKARHMAFGISVDIGQHALLNAFHTWKKRIVRRQRVLLGGRVLARILARTEFGALYRWQRYCLDHIKRDWMREKLEFRAGSVLKYIYQSNHILLRNVVSAWQNASINKTNERKLSLQHTQFVFLMRCKASSLTLRIIFAGWIAAVKFAHMCVRLSEIFARMRRRKLADTMGIWTRFTSKVVVACLQKARENERKRISARLGMHFGALSKGRCFTTWRETVIIGKTARMSEQRQSNVGRMLGIWKHQNLLRISFGGWLNGMRQERQKTSNATIAACKMTRVLDSLVKRNLMHVLVLWIRRLNGALMITCLRYQTTFRDRMEKTLQLNCGAVLLRRTFTGWNNMRMASRVKSNRIFAMIASNDPMHLLRLSWSGWRRVHQTVMNMRLGCSRLSSTVSVACIRVLLPVWSSMLRHAFCEAMMDSRQKSYKQKKHLMSTICKKMLGSSLSRVLTAWASAAATQKASVREEKKQSRMRGTAVRFGTAYTLRLSFSAWRTFMKRISSLQSGCIHLAKVLTSASHRTFSSALSLWGGFLRRSLLHQLLKAREEHRIRLYRTFTSHLSAMLLKNIVLSWRNVCRTTKEKNELTGHRLNLAFMLINSNDHRQILGNILRAWRRVQAHQQFLIAGASQLNHILGNIISRCQQRVLFSWLRFLHRSGAESARIAVADNKARLAKVLCSSSGNVLVKSMFTAWAVLFQDTKRRRTKGGQISKVFHALTTGQLLMPSFHGWSTFVRKRRAGAKRVCAVIASLTTSKLQAALAHWSRRVFQYILASHRAQMHERRKEVLRKFVASLWMSSISAVFAAWAKYCIESAQTRKRAAFVLTLSSDRSVLCGSFGAWKDLRQLKIHRARSVNVLCRTMKSSMSRCTKNAFSQWLENDRRAVHRELQLLMVTEKQRQAFALFSGKQLFSLGASFREWHLFVKTEKMSASAQKNRQGAALLFMHQFQRGTVLACFSAWSSLCRNSAVMSQAFARFGSAVDTAFRRKFQGIISHWLRTHERCQIAETALAREVHEKILAKLQRDRDDRMLLTVILIKWKQVSATELMNQMSATLAATRENLKKNAVTSIWATDQFVIHKYWKMWADVVHEARRVEQLNKEGYERRLKATNDKFVELKKAFGRKQETLLSDTFRGWFLEVSQCRFERSDAKLSEEKSRARDLQESLQKHIGELHAERLRSSGLWTYINRRRDYDHRKIGAAYQFYLLRWSFREWCYALSLIAANARNEQSNRLHTAQELLRERDAIHQSDQQQLVNLLEELEAWKQSDVLRRNQVALKSFGNSARDTLVRAFRAWAGPMGRIVTWQERTNATNGQLQQAFSSHMRLQHIVGAMDRLHVELLSASKLRSLLYAWRFLVQEAVGEKRTVVETSLKKALLDAQAQVSKEQETHEECARLFQDYRSRRHISDQSLAHLECVRRGLASMADSLRIVFSYWAATVRNSIRERASVTRSQVLRCAARRKPVALALRLWRSHLASIVRSWRQVATASGRKRALRRCFVVAFVRTVQNSLNARLAQRFSKLRLAASQSKLELELDLVRSQHLRLKFAQKDSALGVLRQYSCRRDTETLRVAFAQWGILLRVARNSARLHCAAQVANLRRACGAARSMAVSVSGKSAAFHILLGTVRVWRLATSEWKSRLRLQKAFSVELEKQDRGLLATAKFFRRHVLKQRAAHVFSGWARCSGRTARVIQRITRRQQRLTERILRAWSRLAGVSHASVTDAHKRAYIGWKYYCRKKVVRSWALWVAHLRSVERQKKIHIGQRTRQAWASHLSKRLLCCSLERFYRAWSVSARRRRLCAGIRKAQRHHFAVEILLNWRHVACAERARLTARTLFCERIRALIHRKTAPVFARLRTFFEQMLHNDVHRIFQSSVGISQKHDRLLRDLDRSNLLHFQFKDKFRQGRKELENILKQKCLEDVSPSPYF